DAGKTHGHGTRGGRSGIKGDRASPTRTFVQQPQYRVHFGKDSYGRFPTKTHRGIPANRRTSAPACRSGSSGVRESRYLAPTPPRQSSVVSLPSRTARAWPGSETLIPRRVSKRCGGLSRSAPRRAAPRRKNALNGPGPPRAPSPRITHPTTELLHRRVI